MLQIQSSELFLLITENLCPLIFPLPSPWQPPFYSAFMKSAEHCVKCFMYVILFIFVITLELGHSLIHSFLIPLINIYIYYIPDTFVGVGESAKRNRHVSINDLIKQARIYALLEFTFYRQNMWFTRKWINVAEKDKGRKGM